MAARAETTLTPATFGLPGEYQWYETEPRRLGTVMLTHTLEVGIRRLVALEGCDIGYPEKDAEVHPDWHGLGFTLPNSPDVSWQCEPHPVRDNLRFGYQVGKDLVGRESVGGGRTAIHGEKFDFLAVGEVTYWRVGSSAMIAVVEPNPDFEPRIAKRILENPDEVPDSELTGSLLEQADFDPARYIALAVGERQLQTEQLHLAVSTKTHFPRIFLSNHDLASGVSLAA